MKRLPDILFLALPVAAILALVAVAWRALP